MVKASVAAFAVRRAIEQRYLDRVAGLAIADMQVVVVAANRWSDPQGSRTGSLKSIGFDVAGCGGPDRHG